MPKVGLSTGVERRELLRKAAYYIRSETAKQISSKLIIMPRVSPPGADMVRSRGDAIRGVLEELLNFHDDEIKYFEFEEIIICGNTDEMEGMDQFALSEQMRALPLRMENLYEKGPWDEIEIQDVNGDPRTIRVNQQIKKSKLRVSISVPSSDPAFGIYGSLQNMIFAVHPADRVLLQGVPEDVRLSDQRAKSVSSSMLLSEMARKKKYQPERYNITHEALKKQVSTHHETDSDISLQYRTLYRNLARLAEHVMPDLAYVDGTYVVDGLDTRLDGGFALSGDDPVAVDTVLAEILEMDISSLGHLQYLQDRQQGCADPDGISVAMGSPDDLDIEFTPHPDEEQRLDWRHVRLPDENGEAVGYIPPEDASEDTDEGSEEATEEEPEQAEQETSDSDSVDTSDGTAQEQDDEETTESTAEEEEAGAVEGDSVRERVRNRLQKRGKLEGEGSVETEPSEPASEEGEETPSDEGSADQTDEGKAEKTKEEEEEEEEETGAEPEPESEAAGEASDEDLSVRERVRRRLIRRGKLEGDLPEGAEGGEQKTTAETAEEDEKTRDSEKDEKDTEGAKSEDEAEATPAEEQQVDQTAEDEAETSETGDVEDQPDDVRERVRHRLIRRGKLEGDLPEGEVEQASTDDEEQEASSSDQSQEKLDGKPAEADSTETGSSEAPETVEQVDEVQEDVEVTESSGPTLRPSEEVSDSEEVLSNLSSYDSEEKIRHRLAIRQQAVDGSTDSRGGTSQEDPQDQSGGDGTEQSEGEASQSEQEEQADGGGTTEEKEEDSAGQETDESGYTRDPDAPLRERVKERLTKRGKLE